MSDIIIFAMGFVLFAVTTSATMWFGYQQFNRIYRDDMAHDPSAPVLMSDGSNFEYRVPADQVDQVGFRPIAGESTTDTRHLTSRP
jgi:hypothetical protein